MYVRNIKIKSMNFHKRSQKKINEYIDTHKVYRKSSTIAEGNWNVRVNTQNIPHAVTNMQNDQNIQNKPTLKVCSRCGFRNNSNATVCRNCNTRF